MSRMFVKGVLLGSVCSGLVFVASAALAGSGVGGVFNLGQTNSVDAGSILVGTSGGVAQLHVANRSAAASSYGVKGVVNSTSAVASEAGVFGFGSGQATGVWGSGKVGVRGYSSDGLGVVGTTTTGIGVYGSHSGSSGAQPGVRGDTVSTANNAYGVLGQVNPPFTYGGRYSAAVRGINAASKEDTAYGIWGTAQSGVGVYGNVASSAAVVGGVGVVGAGGYTGVYGHTSDVGAGVLGDAKNGIGVFGATSSNGEYAGYFLGPADVTGDLSVGGSLNVAGTKNFRIDDPLDPQGKLLVHAAVESNEVLNVYTGNVTTDGQGLATVQLPAYFERINSDYRYQLTIVGSRGWNARVTHEIDGNRFTIQSDQPNVKVSWQVTARRNDLYMRAHPFRAEQAKTGAERGRYVDPQAYGQPASQAIDAVKPPPQPPLPPASASQPLPTPPGANG
jgi:hypothetical protein